MTRGIATLSEIEERWSIDDVGDANHVLDAIDAAQAAGKR